MTTYASSLDVGCPACGATYTVHETHDCAGYDLWAQRDATAVGIGELFCACGSLKSRRSERCRACWRADKSRLGNNNFRLRPELLAKAIARRSLCECGAKIMPGALPAHLRSHDLWLHVDASGDCWEWTGATTNGYGVFGPVCNRKRAHRAVWEALVGPIAPGLVIDHLCRNTRCVNPDHLQPVTIGENTIRRGFSPTARKVRGHISGVPA